MTEQDDSLGKKLIAYMRQLQSEHIQQTKRIRRTGLIMGLTGLVMAGLGVAGLESRNYLNSHNDAEVMQEYRHTKALHREARENLFLLEKQADLEQREVYSVPQVVTPELDKLDKKRAQHKAILAELIQGYKDLVEQKQEALEIIEESSPEYQAYKEINEQLGLPFAILGAAGLCTIAAGLGITISRLNKHSRDWLKKSESLILNTTAKTPEELER
jgi:hypothetical protein